MSNLYYSPEDFGLTVVKDHDVADAYEFDQIVIWRRDDDGAYFIAHDAGCSCPSPFDNLDVDDLHRVHTLADVAGFAREIWGDDEEAGVTALLDGLRLP